MISYRLHKGGAQSLPEKRALHRILLVVSMRMMHDFSL
jgi:hypothetical protein